MALSASGRASARAAVVLVATLIGVAVTANLGTWQMHRAAQKLALQSALDSRARLPALAAADLTTSSMAAEPQHYRLARLRGRWVPAATVFLDNRQMDGRVGFFVVTPLRLAGRGDAVLVQRGWVPRDGRDRTLLPAVPAPVGEVEVAGHIAPPPARLYEFRAPLTSTRILLVVIGLKINWRHTRLFPVTTPSGTSCQLAPFQYCT